MTEPNGNGNGRATIREVYALLGQVKTELAGQLEDVEERLMGALKQHVAEHDRASSRGRHWTTTLLNVVGIAASLGVAVLALALR